MSSSPSSPSSQTFPSPCSEIQCLTGREELYSMMHFTEAKVVLFGLEESLATELREALSRCSHASVSDNMESPGLTLAVLAIESADLIFCGPSLETVKTLRAQSPNTSIVVVSRLPEVMDWLDAMEAGADDYCAPPFEDSHIRWILANNLRQASRVAA